jgi:phosphatidylinositol glycan class W
MSVLPLFILGFARFATHRAVNYQEHVTEYGVHWNFFVTLTVITVLAAAVNLPEVASGIAALILMVTYELALQNGLTEYILHAPRDNLFNANREGICS